jgi:hypothetical protein
MEKLIETLFGWFFGSALFFENLKARRTDDPFLAEYKAKQRACAQSVLASLAILVVGAIAASLLPETLGPGPAGQAVRVLLGYISIGFAGLALGAFLWMAIAWVSLYRFIRQHGIE